MNRLADFQVRNVDFDHFRQIFWQCAHPNLEKYVLEDAAAGLDTGRFAGAFDRYHDGDLFIGRHFVQIDMQNLGFERVVLNFLEQGQALRGQAGQVAQESRVGNPHSRRLDRAPSPTARPGRNAAHQKRLLQ